MTVKYEWLRKLRDLLLKEPQTFDMRFHSTCAIGFAIDKGLLPGEWVECSGTNVNRTLTLDALWKLCEEMNLPYGVKNNIFDYHGYRETNGKEVPSRLVVEKINLFLMGVDSNVSNPET